MIKWIILRKLLAGLVLPPAGPLGCAVLGLALSRWYPRVGKTLAWLGVCSVVAFSLPVVSTWLVVATGGEGTLDVSRPVAAQAVVILGGGVRHGAPEYGGATLGQLTLERVRYGAYVARKTKLPVMVTGGAPSGGEPEAELMKNALEQEYGIAVRWMEARSRNTRENARYSAATLRPDRISRVLLVTHVFDATRARLEFEDAGFEVVSAPTGVGQPSAEPSTLLDYFPSARALQTSYYACYELLALSARRLVGL